MYKARASTHSSNSTVELKQNQQNKNPVKSHHLLILLINFINSLQQLNAFLVWLCSHSGMLYVSAKVSQSVTKTVNRLVSQTVTKSVSQNVR